MSWSDRTLLIESVCMLAAARLLVLTTPRRRLVSRMGGSPVSGNVPHSAGAAPAPGSSTGARVGVMLERTAKYTWWRSMCLEKALAGKWMLRRRGIPTTMFVGVARQGEALLAHAWLVGQGQTLTGAGNISFAPLAEFREPGGSGPARPNVKIG